MITFRHLIRKNGVRKGGDKLPFSEPAWYDSGSPPYYNDHYRAYRAKIHGFVEEEIIEH